MSAPSHACADLLTVYGTQLFASLSDQRFSLSLTYLVDAYFTAIPLLTMLVIVRHQRSTRLPGPDWVRQLGGAYHAADALEWTRELRPDHISQDAVVREVWRQAALGDFRKFARYPVLARIDREPNSECLWFTDRRYTVPVLRPFFRYGMCRDGDSAPWSPYRIRRYTDEQLQPL